MNSLVFHYLPLLGPAIYVFIFAAMVIEGEVFLFAAAFLASQGFLSPELTFLTIFGGAMAGDSLWYWLGHKINHSETFISRWLVAKTGRFDEHLLNNSLRTIFISKFVYGAHHLMMARAGVIKLKFREFFKDDFLANLAWVAIIGGLGYLSGASFQYVKHYLKFTEYALALGVVLFFIADFLIGRYGLEKKI
ncbi:MAG: VTT domain-containing protein [Candidatus Portnoybacteria bacterium]|nr:VTT domain-containing protein [Candidatus Portnoybacteria bacterium]MDD4982362.1 VTT domain-containing protein [Candidatus Portnoybacteria bacterium]